MDFRMYGRMNLPKETENFKPFRTRTSENGYEIKELNFNMICGDNRHMMRVSSITKADGNGVVYTFTKSGVDDNGNKVKGETIQIPFKDRLTDKRLADVADFRKFVVDLEQLGRRDELNKALDRVRTGTSLTDEEIAKLGINDQSELEAEIKKSEKKHHEFISEYDFIDFLMKVMESDKYKDATFYIRGRADYRYSEQNERVYETYIPQRVYLANGCEQSAVATMDFYYGKDSLDTNSADTKNRYYVNGFLLERDNTRKENIPVETTISLVLPDADASDAERRYIAGLKRKFTVDGDNFVKLKIDVDMINGAQQQKVSLEDLPDEVREDVEYGLVTLEEIQREMGMTYGERIREYRFKGFGYGQKSKPREETAFTADDFVIKSTADELSDLFDDDDEL